MTNDCLVKLFEHNNWANERLIDACSVLTDGQLDAAPPDGDAWTLRHTLTHLVSAQRGYLSLLTLPVEARRHAPLTFAELGESARASGAGLLALAQTEAAEHPPGPLRTTDGYLVAPWVVMVQVINHAHDHRHQVRGLLQALGVTPPRLDAWCYAEATGALVRTTE